MEKLNHPINLLCIFCLLVRFGSYVLENMNILHSELILQKIPCLERYIRQSKGLYDIHMNAYSLTCIKKVLGKLIDFFESIEDLLKTVQPSDVSFHVQFGKSILKDIIKKYPLKEVGQLLNSQARRGLEAIYKQVEKQFMESCDPQLKKIVWMSIQQELTAKLTRYEAILQQCYPDIKKFEFTIEDILHVFNDINKSAEI